jgi:nijmegen breakage syndrome protein 1
MAVNELAVESQSLFVSQNTEVDMDREASQPPETQTRNSRKRPASPIIEEEEEDFMETMAPAAAALKRRRLALGDPTPPPAAPMVKEKPAPVKPEKKAKQTRKQKPNERECNSNWKTWISLNLPRSKSSKWK